MNRPVRVAVFASGGGTNLQALLDHFNGAAESLARVELVVASRHGIGASSRAAAAGVPNLVIEAGGRAPEAVGASIMDALDEHDIDLVALAGYLKLVPTNVVERFRGSILNIHPALLPAFGGWGMYGARVHEAVLDSGARVSGATVHHVDERYDEGGIVAQWPVPVLPGDTPGRLASRVLRVEHLLYPLGIEMVVRGEAAGRPEAERAFELSSENAPTIESLRQLLA
ncbi:MAG: phosphoribosylglycinamide formyltransferase [Gemmatimonadota bacterium]